MQEEPEYQSEGFRRRAGLQPQVLAAVVLAVGLALTLVVWRSLDSQAERVARARFDVVVNDTMTRLDQRIEAYAQILRGGAGLLSARPGTDRAAWASYFDTLQIEQRFPGMQTFLWVPLVPEGQQKETETRIRALGHPEFQIWTRGSVPPSTTIAFVEPFVGVNRKALGFDMYSEPVRREAMERARDTGEMAISSKVMLVIDERPLPGFVMYIPVFRGGAMPADRAGRRAALVGYVAAAFRVADLLHGTIGGKASQARIQVFDSQDRDALGLLYDSDQALGNRATGDVRRSQTVQFRIGGRHWVLNITAARDFDAVSWDFRTMSLVFAGVLLSALAAWTAALALSLRRQTDTLSELTRALQSHQEELEVANAAMTQARDDAVAAAKSKSEFLANMSHEIRTPIHGFLGHTELALGSPLDPETRGYLETAQSCGHALLHVVNDILDFSKLEAGKLDLEHIGFELRTLLLQCVRTVAIAAQAKNLSLVWSAGEDVPDRLLGDPNRLRQVLLNLLSNAVKFTSEGEVEVSVDLEADDASGPRLRFAVRDTGIGMSAQTRDRLFEAFFQADASITRQYGGTGLGLAISARMVGLMGGRLGADSTPGEGSRFHFAIPLDADGEAATPLPDETHRVAIVDASAGRARALGRLFRYHGIGSRHFANLESARADTLPWDAWIVDAGTIAGEAWRPVSGNGELPPRLIVLSTQNAVKIGGDDAPPVVQRRYPVDARDVADIVRAASESVARKELPRPAAAPRPSAAALRVLIAEDNAVNRALIERMLGRLGQPAMVVNDGAAAVAAAAMQDFDLILMDLQMPVMDGIEATQVIRATERELNRPRVPIHALTADTLPGDRQRCIDAGMDGHLSKPLSLADLQKLLDSLRPAELARAS